MAHYALINSDNIVVKVITGVDENITQIDLDGKEVGGTSEAWEQFYAALPQFAGLTCIRTSYNGTIRANYASVGGKYDPTFNVFIAPQPFPSWKLDYTTYQWVPPVVMPENIEEYTYRWSEINKEWIQVAI